jgi:hypothetical protein
MGHRLSKNTISAPINVTIHECFDWGRLPISSPMTTLPNRSGSGLGSHCSVGLMLFKQLLQPSLVFFNILSRCIFLSKYIVLALK